MRRQIFLDCDGVLADFDRGAEKVLGAPPGVFEKQHGEREFWKRLGCADGFFTNLDPLPDAFQLYEAVKLKDPVILTGMPHGKWAEPQKRAWGERWFPGVPMITTMAALKHEHLHPGDVLVDDRTKYRHLWEDAGGIFILHTSAGASIAALRSLGFLD